MALEDLEAGVLISDPIVYFATSRFVLVPQQIIVLTRGRCAHCAQPPRGSNARHHHADRLQNHRVLAQTRRSQWLLPGNSPRTLARCRWGHNWLWTHEQQNHGERKRNPCPHHNHHISHAHDPIIERMTATAHVVELGLRQEVIPVHGEKEQLILVTVSFNLRSPVVVCCKRIAAVAAAVFAVGRWKTTCRVLLASLPVLPCSHFFLHLSLFPLPLRLWVSLTLSSSRTGSAALLAARHVRQGPRAVRMCGPLSTRIHQAVLHVRHIIFFVH